MNLRQRIKSGLFWVTVSNVVANILSIITRLVLAILLTRADFGLIAGANLTVDILQLFREAGFGTALIYRKEDSEDAQHTAFWFILGSALLLYALAYVGAPLAVPFSLHPNPLIVPVLRVLSLNLIISAFARVPMVVLARELDFRRRAVPDIAPNFVNVIISLGLAYSGWGVWSLVYGRLGATITRVVLAWWVTGWRPRFLFVPKIAKELFDYGKHIMGSQLLIIAITNVDDLFVIHYLGWTPEGAYDYAYRLSNLPATQITRMVGQVMFPALSRLQDEKARFRRLFFLTLRYVAIFAFPLAVGTFLFAPDIVAMIGAQKWHDAILPMQLLGVYGLLRSIAANMGNVFKAGGKPQWLTYIAIWRLATMSALLYPAVKMGGIVGVSALSAGVAIVDFAISGWLANKVLHVNWSPYGRALWPSLLASFLIGALFFFLLPTVGWAPSLWRLLIAGTLFVLFYTVLILLWMPDLREKVGQSWQQLRLLGQRQ